MILIGDLEANSRVLSFIRVIRYKGGIINRRSS